MPTALPRVSGATRIPTSTAEDSKFKSTANNAASLQTEQRQEAKMNTRNQHGLLARATRLWQKVAALFVVVPLMAATMVAAATAADLSNTARARGTGPGGVANAVVSTTDTVDIPVIAKTARYTVAKSVAPGITTNGGAGVDAPGDTFIYTFVVRNTGNVTIDNVVLTDPGPNFGSTAGANNAAFVTALGAATPVKSVNTDADVDVTETWTYTVSYTLAQADINNAVAGGATNNVTNAVSATADDPQNVQVTPNATGSTLTATTTIGGAPSMTIDKTARIKKAGSSGAFVAIVATDRLEVGDQLEYSYLVTNTGNVTLTGVNVNETAFTGNGGIVPPAPTGGASTLAPAAFTTFTSVYTVTQADVDALQ
jgi:hypothetical protein